MLGAPAATTLLLPPEPELSLPQELLLLLLLLGACTGPVVPSAMASRSPSSICSRYISSSERSLFRWLGSLTV